MNIREELKGVELAGAVDREIISINFKSMSTSEQMDANLEIAKELLSGSVSTLCTIHDKADIQGIHQFSEIWNNRVGLAQEISSVSDSEVIMHTYFLPDFIPFNSWTQKELMNRIVFAMDSEITTCDTVIIPAKQLAGKEVYAVSGGDFILLDQSETLSFEQFFSRWNKREAVHQNLKSGEVVSLGSNEIGASSYLLKHGDKMMMIDCGRDVTKKHFNALPNIQGVHDLDYLFISHAHQDHIGGVVHLWSQNPGVKIFMSIETRELFDEVLRKEKRCLKNFPESDFSITAEEIEQFEESAQIVTFANGAGEVAIDDQIIFTPQAAGHIIGASQIHLNLGGHKVLYTGDISFHAQRTVGKAFEFDSDVDLLICEGTSHHFEGDTEACIEEFKQTIMQDIKRGKSILLPAFAMGRAQEVMATIEEIGLPENVALYDIGSSSSITDLYSELGHLEANRFGTIFHSDLPKGIIKQQCIVVATGGMLSKKSSAYKVFKTIDGLANWKTYFTGYTSQTSTAGDLISDRWTEESNNFSTFTFSAHANKNELVNYIEKLSPKKLIMTHGDRFNLQDILFKVNTLTEAVVSEEGVPHGFVNLKAPEISSSAWLRAKTIKAIEQSSLSYGYEHVPNPEVAPVVDDFKTVFESPENSNSKEMSHTLYHLLLNHIKRANSRTCEVLFSSAHAINTVIDQIEHMRNFTTTVTYKEETEEAFNRFKIPGLDYQIKETTWDYVVEGLHKLHAKVEGHHASHHEQVKCFVQKQKRLDDQLLVSIALSNVMKKHSPEGAERLEKLYTQFADLLMMDIRHREGEALPLQSIFEQYPDAVEFNALEVVQGLTEHIEFLKEYRETLKAA